jgi:protein-serine/threonine kinase
LVALAFSRRAAGIPLVERTSPTYFQCSSFQHHPISSLDYAGPEILRGERYYGKEQDVWAFGVVAYVLVVGECPFTTAAEAQDGLLSPFSNASIALDERCLGERERDGEEPDGGGAMVDAAALVRACLQVDLSERPTFDRIMQSRYLAGEDGWIGDDF